MFGILSLGFGIISPMTFAACNPEQPANYKIQLEKDLESYQNLIEMPTLGEKAKIYKDKFVELEKVKIPANLLPIKTKLIDFVKSKTSEFKQNYSVSFANTKVSQDQISSSATVTNMSEYSVDTIGISIRTFDVKLETKTQKIEIKETNLPQIDKEESVVENNNFTEQDHENLLKEKLKNNSPVLTPRESVLEYKKDKRVEYRTNLETTKKELGNIIGSCSTIKAKAVAYYDRLKAKAHAWKWAKGRAPWYANFDLDCTNFGSQVVQAGGYLDTQKWHSTPKSSTPASWKATTNTFYSAGGYTQPNNGGSYITPYQLDVSSAFRGVDDFRYWVHSLDQTSDFYFYKGTNQRVAKDSPTWKWYNGLGDDMFAGNRVTDGDVFWVDSDNNGTWDHTTIITGWYQQADGRWLPTLTYHSNNTSDIGWDVFKSKYPSGANFSVTRFNTLY